MIRPDIGKLSQKMVDSIPLVMYIPPPPETFSIKVKTPPLSEFTYPPPQPKSSVKGLLSSSTPTQALSNDRRGHRFRLFPFKRRTKKGRKSSDKARAVGEEEEEEEEPQTWEDYFYENEYPFVILEGNRAACAICLMDFEEPKKRNFASHHPHGQSKTGNATEQSGAIVTGIIAGSKPASPVVSPSEGETGAAGVSDGTLLASTSKSIEETRSQPQAIPVEIRDGEDHLKLEDAGEGAQPLRLLSCGHVFHVFIPPFSPFVSMC